MIEVGIVGLGFMAATHIKAYRQLEGIRIAALCNPSGRHLDGDFSKVTGNVGDNKPLVLEMSGVKTTRNFEDLLKDPAIHLIDICAPTAAHRELAMAALKAGKHVLCEKPLARSSTAAREIVSAAEKSAGFFMPAMCMRFWPGWSWLKEAINDRRYGRVLGARFRRVAEPPGWGQKNFFNGAESGGGLFDLHIHDADFVQFCFGRPRSVFATGYSKFSGAIDHVVTQYEVTSGSSVHAEGSWAMVPGFGFSMSYTVNFEKATADYDLARGADALKLFEEGGPAQTVTFPGPDGYVLELAHIAEAIRSGKPPTIVTPRDGLSAVEICEAEEKSVQLRQIVSLQKE
jgi:predicted dehydrogenase